MGPADSTADKTRIPGESLTDDGLPQAGDRRPLDRRDGPPDNLGQRMEGLPAGHPSSPYNADGTLRQPIPRLSDLETATETEEPDSADSEPPDSRDTPDRQTSLERPDPDPATADRPPPEPQHWADAEPTADAEPPADAGRATAIEPSSDTDPDVDADRQPPETELAIDQTRPLTDAEWAEHIIDVRDRLDKAHADGLATNRQFTIDPNGQSWTEERRTAQDLIINSIYASADNVPNQHRAIVAGGLGGAGKTTVLADHAGIDQSQYLTVNPDDIKEELAKLGLIPEVGGLSPMEASDLVHEESSYIARQLALRAQADGKNLIWDITMSSRVSAERRIDELRAAGYERIEGIFVDIPVEVSARRADARHRIGQDDYRSGVGLGGRFVPPDVIMAQADPDWGSRNRKAFEELKPRFDQWIQYDNSVGGRAPVLTEASPSDDNPEETTA